MAQNDAIISPKPPIIEVFDNIGPYQMQWLERAGGSWIPDHAVPYTWSGLAVHWSEQKTGKGMTRNGAIERAAAIARFHAYNRDWDSDVSGIQGSDGIQYHYVIGGGVTLQTRPETKHLWHATAANKDRLAICILAGHGDSLDPANVDALEALLAWFCYGRPDLPLITPRPGTVTILLPDGHTRAVNTHGVMTHDECRKAEGLPPKGCCGIYSPVVAEWRRKATM